MIWPNQRGISIVEPWRGYFLTTFKSWKQWRQKEFGNIENVRHLLPVFCFLEGNTVLPSSTVGFKPFWATAANKFQSVKKYINILILILFVYCFFFIIWAWYDMISQLIHKFKYVVWHFTSKSWKSKRPVTRRRTTVMNSTTTIPLSKKPIWNDWQSFGENYECLISGACDPSNIHAQCSMKTKVRKIHTVFCCWQIWHWKSFKKIAT